MIFNMKKRLETLKMYVKDFETVQEMYRKFGAWDTEPSAEFQVQIARALKHEPWKNLTIRQWELYSMTGAGEAARALNAAAKKVFEFIKKTPVGPFRDIGPYLKDYCWRVAINL